MNCCRILTGCMTHQAAASTRPRPEMCCHVPGPPATWGARMQQLWFPVGPQTSTVTRRVCNRKKHDPRGAITFPAPVTCIKHTATGSCPCLLDYPWVSGRPAHQSKSHFCLMNNDCVCAQIKRAGRAQAMYTASGAFSHIPGNCGREGVELLRARLHSSIIVMPPVAGLLRHLLPCCSANLHPAPSPGDAAAGQAPASHTTPLPPPTNTHFTPAVTVVTAARRISLGEPHSCVLVWHHTRLPLAVPAASSC